MSYVTVWSTPIHIQNTTAVRIPCLSSTLWVDLWYFPWASLCDNLWRRDVINLTTPGIVWGDRGM